jgi:AraC-like DNA-binding protein
LTEQIFLRNFPILDGNRPDEIRRVLEQHDIRSFEVEKLPANFRMRVNHHRSNGVNLSWAHTAADVRVGFRKTEVVRLSICLAGKGRITAAGEAIELTPEQGRIVQENSAPLCEYGAGYQHLALAFDAQILKKKLWAFLGFEPGGTLKFEAAADFRQPDAQRLRRLIFFFAQELDLAGAEISEPILAELHDLLIAAFLSANRNTFSDLIAAGDKRAGHWQVRLVEDYIEANWNQAITIEVLAAVSGASARSIFHSFRQSRGYSPKVFLKSVRLRHAERMLAQADPNSSVTAVALACGFLNLGHFARDYRATFGVLPSETLRRARRVGCRRGREANTKKQD